MTTDDAIADENVREVPVSLMFLVDSSASMGERLSACEVMPCPTRLQVLQRAITTVFAETAFADTKLGFLPFPSSSGACEVYPGDSVGRIGVTLASSTHAAVRSKVEALTPIGERPLALAATALAGDNTLFNSGRPTYVVLLTAGAPNCNPNNPNSTCMAVNNSCRCTLADGDLRACLGPVRSDGFDPCSEGCTDASASVDALRNLRTRGVSVYVIAVAPNETDSDALEVMAQAGGAWAKCVSGKDSACGPAGTCNLSTGRCRRSFYWARTQNDVVSALEIVRRRAATSR